MKHVHFLAIIVFKNLHQTKQYEIHVFINLKNVFSVELDGEQRRHQETDKNYRKPLYSILFKFNYLI